MGEPSPRSSLPTKVEVDHIDHMIGPGGNGGGAVEVRNRDATRRLASIVRPIGSALRTTPLLVLRQAVCCVETDRLSVLLARISYSTMGTSSTCPIRSARCIECGEGAATEEKPNSDLAGPTQNRRAKHALFSATTPRRSWKIGISAWWAHQGSNPNLGPAD